MIGRIGRIFSGEKTPTVGPGSQQAHRSDLASWWRSEFTKREQSHILEVYQPAVVGDGAKNRNLELILSGRISLAALATWFANGEDIDIARRIMSKSVEMDEATSGSALDQHFVYYNMIRVYYRDRDSSEDALPLAIDACEKQIALAPHAAREWRSGYPGDSLPLHPGFRQLSIIREKEGNFEEAIRLCEEALQQGWAGDWERRIERCSNRIARKRG